MTLHSFINRLTQLFTWLYYQHLWEAWEFLAIGIAVLIPLFWIAIRQRKEKAARLYERERSPIIGVKLANARHPALEITESKKARSHLATGGKNKQDDTTRQADSSNEQIKMLQCEIARYRQNEARLEQQLTELTDANEKLKHEIDEIKQTEEHHRQQTIELPAKNKKHREKHGEHKRIEDTINNQTDLAPATGGHPIDPKHADEPLDVEKLKSIAALAKQIQQNPRPELT